MNRTWLALCACAAQALLSETAHAQWVDCASTTGYSIAGGEVYFFVAPAIDKSAGSISKVKGADAKSFRPIQREQSDPCGVGYGRDDMRVFHRENVLPGADPESFGFIEGTYYAKDKNAVYGPRGFLTSRVGTFQVLPSGYATDGSRHFFQDLAIEGSGFEILPWGYSKTSDRVFYQGRPISGMHSPSFSVLPGSSLWTKDERHVYYKNQPIPNLDPETVESIDGMYVRDKRTVFYGNTLLKGLSPTEARVLPNSTYIMDGTFVFAGATKLDRDASSFQKLGFGWSKDSRAVYFEDAVVSEADTKSFQAPSLGNASDKNYQFEINGKVRCRLRAEAPAPAAMCSR